MGGFVGTPQYASPEQIEEKDLDIRSDIYCLGMTLWYMLAGRPPFVGPLGSVFIQQLTKEPPWDHLTGQPEQVKALLGRLLQKDPDNRPQSPDGTAPRDRGVSAGHSILQFSRAAVVCRDRRGYHVR